ncbi:YusW-like protein [Oceanobacillus limi]|uniref:YusW-like protein n=1 Tax=Oceanobacillus limi TaxID=930131 RepID=A0A1I0FGX1_9BACI|nr:YusW family protein [Oceanobacillus limi]SET57269.1 YusW-like protein [Oceanobacillus limi]
MKELFHSVVLFLTCFVLVACAADNEDSTKDPQELTEIESQEVMNRMDMEGIMEQLDYRAYDFDVLYEDSEFEGEIEDDDGLIEAEFYHPFDDVNVRGSDAVDAIFPVLQKLELTPEMTDEEAVEASIAAFHLPENYLKASLEVVFNDGTEKEYEIKK